MTVSGTSTHANLVDPTLPGAHQQPYRPRLKENVGCLVDQHIGGTKGQEGLQTCYRRNEARARGELAALRKDVNRPPGELPGTWDPISVHVPGYAGDVPTWEETAVHTAMMLHAVHQQSRTDSMLASGKGPGHAARSLIGPPDDENPSTRARFNALVTSTIVTELCHRLWGFVSLLRVRSITLDHAMLADDILHFQQPGGVRRIRLTWSREHQFLSAGFPTSLDDATLAPATNSTTTAPTPEN